MTRLSEVSVGEKNVWGKQAEWVDYSGQIGSEAVGIVMMDHPSNQRYPTYWHSRGYGLHSINPFGLHDMHGNVYEWCVDWHMIDFYRRSPVIDPVNLDRGTALGRVVRGGGFGELADHVRSAARSYQAPDDVRFPNGFRVAIVGKLR